MQIRDAQPSDAPAIAAIWNPIIRDTVVTFNPAQRSAEEIAAMITDRQHAGYAFLVAEEGAALLGFASYSQFRAGLGYARTMEHTINLAPEARGRGLGSLLLGALEAHATGAGCHVMVGAITSGNLASIAFHARQGYTEVGRMPQVGWKFGQYHDLTLMQKVLSDQDGAV